MNATATVLDLAHYSMQFSDTEKQMKRDVRVMFDRNYDWITGTEAGEQPLRRALRLASHENGYTFFEYKSNFIAVRKSLIVPGSYRKDGDTVIDNDLTWGRGHDPSIARVQFRARNLGPITVLCSHYPVRGKPDGNKSERVNLKWNKVLAGEIDEKADAGAAGKGLCFYGGDQNIVDRTADTFFGGSLTSAWDELEKYENTGHGNIDVIASHDGDTRVSAKYVRALDDDEQFMFMDHFPVEAGYRVEHI